MPHFDPFDTKIMDRFEFNEAGNGIMQSVEPVLEFAPGLASAITDGSEQSVIANADAPGIEDLQTKMPAIGEIFPEDDFWF